jgi:hypothetical protein
MIRLSVVAGGAVLFLFFVANLADRGFPLTHVEQKPMNVPTQIGPDEKPLPRFNGGVTEERNNWALAFNVLAGAALTLDAGCAGSEIARRVSVPTPGEALQSSTAGAGVVDEREDAGDRHEQPG